MRPTRPLTVSLPLGLFSTVTMSVPANPLEISSTRVPLDPKLLDMPNVGTDMDELNEGISSDEESA